MVTTSSTRLTNRIFFTWSTDVERDLQEVGCTHKDDQERDPLKQKLKHQDFQAKNRLDVDRRKKERR